MRCGASTSPNFRMKVHRIRSSDNIRGRSTDLQGKLTQQIRCMDSRFSGGPCNRARSTTATRQWCGCRRRGPVTGCEGNVAGSSCTARRPGTPTPRR